MDQKNAIIAILVIVVIITSGGAIYFATMAGPTTTTPTEKVNFTVGTTLEIGRVPHPQYVHGGDDPIVNQMFEALFGYVGTTLVLEPVLATDMGTVSANGLEYTFTLRQGIMFHDGTPFNASCVKDHFDRMFTVNRGMTYIFVEDLLNKTDVVDTYTVKFTLNFANSDFRGMLAHIAAMIPSPTATALYGELDGEHPVGTGPFKFVSKIIDNEVVMEANQDWWQLAAGETIKIDELVFVQLSDASTMKLAIESGEIDATDGRFNLVDYESLLANANLVSHDLSAASSARWMTFCMNGSTWDHFPNKTLRQAMAYAIPYDQIISVVLDGNAERLYSFLPPEYIGYKQAFSYDYNITKAIELIEAAGFTAPLAVELHITPTHYGVTEPDVAALIAEYAEDAFDITIFQSEYGAYKDAFKQTSSQEFMIWAWTADYPSTDNWATPFMSSGGFGMKYSEVLEGDMATLYPYVDDLVQEAAGTVNETRKLEILDELQDLWNEYLPNIFLWREVQYQFTRSYVSGAVYGVLRYDVHYEDVVIT